VEEQKRWASSIRSGSHNCAGARSPRSRPPIRRTTSSTSPAWWRPRAVWPRPREPIRRSRSPPPGCTIASPWRRIRRNAEASRLAAAAATDFLAAIGYPAGALSGIAHAVEAHSFSAGIPPRTIEARVVQDADRLDALGAVGIARTIALGGARGAPLYATIEPFPHTRQPDDRASVIDHFYTKLLTLAGTMRTATGRAEAAARTAFMRDFLAQLGREIGAVPPPD